MFKQRLCYRIARRTKKEAVWEFVEGGGGEGENQNKKGKKSVGVVKGSFFSCSVNKEKLKGYKLKRIFKKPTLLIHNACNYRKRCFQGRITFPY